MNKYTGKKAVVIGGTHGMGLATVRALLTKAGITEADIDEYLRSYTAPDAMRSSLAYYRSIPQDRKCWSISPRSARQPEKN